ncbi:hypothetical protein N9934_02785 [Desulfosarcina sp.]|nr:hypothetical protein [Desulfosarcina sp.]
MKIFIALLNIIALLLIIFNVTKIDFEALFQGESVIALITIFASLCVILLLQILRLSKRIERHPKNKK